MLKRSAALFSAVLLCTVQFAVIAISPAQAAVSDWQKGATMVPVSSTDFGSGSFLQSLQNLKNTGANYVALIVPYYQSNPYSTDIAPGYNTPTDASLAAAIDQAHALGMRVTLKMHIENYDGTWRAQINPGDRDAWFGAYNRYLVAMARIAQAHNAEMLVIGTELVSMAASNRNADNTQRWVGMINNVRGVYSGKLTYSANSTFNNDDPFLNEKKFIGFWPNLDYAGISAYYQLNAGDNSVAAIKGAWDYWNNNDLRGFAASVGKPVLIAEVGYRSISGARYAPWDWQRGGGPDETEQANLYEALFSYWNDYGYIAGVYLWDWSTNPNAGGASDNGYTPQNKQAQQVMTNWFTAASPPSTTPPPAGGGSTSGAFTSSGGASPAAPVAGTAVSLSATVKNNGGAFSGGIVDIEVYDQGNNKVFQKFFEGQSFAAGESKTLSASWTPSAAGTYKMAIGVFTAGWASNPHWNSSAASVAVGSGGTPPPAGGGGSTPVAGQMDIWWPTDGTNVSGTQPFKGLVRNIDLSQYKMFWQVDGDRLNEMANSTEGYPHKESIVDLSGWRWRGNGPYRLNFVAKDGGGATIAEKIVNISVF